MRRLLPVLVVIAVLGPAASASAKAYLPPPGKAWHGVASGRDAADFASRTGRPPAVWQHWIQWGRHVRVRAAPV